MGGPNAGDGAVFHLGLTKAMLKGATVAVIPGDPARSKRISEFFENPTFLATAREFTSYLGTVNGKPIVVCSTGIGGPSTSIAVEELAQLGVRTFLRLGTTGGLAPHVKAGDVVVTTGSVRLDGASLHFAPMEYPAVADFDCTTALVAACREKGVEPHKGITASSDTFYPGQERYDTVSGYVRKAYQGSMAEWQKLNVLNFEMESSTLFTMCSASGWRAGCVAGVIVNRNEGEFPSHEVAAQLEKKTIEIVLAAAGNLA